MGKKKEDRVRREEFEEFKEWQGDINVDDAGAITELRRALAALTEQVEGLKGSSRPPSKEAGDSTVNLVDWLVEQNADSLESLSELAVSQSDRARVAEARVKELERGLRQEIGNVRFLYEHNPDMHRGLEFSAQRLERILSGDIMPGNAERR